MFAKECFGRENRRTAKTGKNEKEKILEDLKNRENYNNLKKQFQDRELWTKSTKDRIAEYI